MKQHELEVHELREVEGNGSVMSYYSKGHHDKNDFTKAVHYEYGFEITDTNSVKHTFFRNIPHPEFRLVIDEVRSSESKRGAYPVTVFEL